MSKPELPPYGPLSRPDVRSPTAKGIEALVARAQRERETEAVMDAERSAGGNLTQAGLPFVSDTLDLGDATFIANGKVMGVQGEKLIFMRDGSTAGARLDVEIGGTFLGLSPGSRIEMPFRGFTVKRNAQSAVKGKARILVVKNERANFIEDAANGGLSLLAPVDLLGDSKAGTYVTVAEDTQPSGAAPQGSFNATGFKRVRVYVDGQAANTLESVTLVPWVRDPDTGLWSEQGIESFDLPDSVATAYRYRVFTFTVKTFGLMFFEVRSLLPAGATQLGFIVQGVE